MMEEKISIDSITSRYIPESRVRTDKIKYPGEVFPLYIVLPDPRGIKFYEETREIILLLFVL